MVSAVRGEWERGCDWTERVGEDVYLSFRGLEKSDKQIKVERATGP